MNDDRPMPLSFLTGIILQLNAEMDTGKYDSIGLVEVKKAIASRSVVPWLRKNVPGADLSYLSPQHIAIYHDHLASIHDGYAGNERRKWGIENRGLCLLVAWTNEIVQQAVGRQVVKPLD